MAHPVIALVTDFGTVDHYVGAMKGVMLGICRDASFVDITHDIAPHDIVGAALELDAAHRYFPEGTVFLTVVDPGVGSTRRALAAQADPYVFVAPDNGVLSAVFNRQPPSRLVEISQPRYVRATVSRTFEGRDRFAPAAAWLARGVPMASLGPTIGNWERIAIPSASPDAHGLRGEILRIDRFGNLITNVDRRIWNQVVGSEPVIIRSGGVAARLVETYGEIAAGEVGALFGSSDRLELAVCEGSAVERLGLRRGDEVLVTFASAMRSTS